MSIQVFLKQCENNLVNCKINQSNDNLVAELKLNILKKAATYQKEIIEKNKKENPYVGVKSKGGDAPKEDN